MTLTVGILASFDPVKWTGSFRPATGQPTLTKNVPVLHPYVHPEGGEGSYAMPRAGAHCLHIRPASGADGRGYILGFFAPFAEGTQSHAAGRTGVGPGDSVMQTADGVRVGVQALRGVELRADELCAEWFDAKSGEIQVVCERWSSDTPASHGAFRSLPPEEDAEGRSGTLLEGDIRRYVEDENPTLQWRAGAAWDGEEDRFAEMQVLDAGTGEPVAVFDLDTTGAVRVSTDEALTVQGVTSPGDTSAVVLAPLVADLASALEALSTALQALGAPAIPQITTLITNARASASPYLSKRIFSD